MPSIDYSCPFTPSTDALLFRAENLLTRIDEKFLADDILQTIRVPLLAVEAISATCHQKRCDVSVISLIRAFNYFEDKVVFDFDKYLSEAIERPVGKEVITLTKEALFYMRALSWTAKHVKSGSEISIETIRVMHELCCSGSVKNSRCRGFRTKQMQRGNSQVSTAAPCAGTETQCPPPQLLPELMHSLCAFASADSYSALGQASVIHFNLERIMPFDELVDLTGLVLAYAIFFRRGLLKSLLMVPFSWSGTGNYAYREKALHPYQSPHYSEKEDLAQARNRWAVFNAENTIIAVEVVSMFFDSILALNKKWRLQPRKISRGSTLDRLLRMLLGTPVITASQAARSLGKSFSAANDALFRLEKWGIVTSRAINNKERLFIAQESVDLTTKLTHKLMTAKNLQEPESASCPENQVRPDKSLLG